MQLLHTLMVDCLHWIVELCWLKMRIWGVSDQLSTGSILHLNAVLWIFWIDNNYMSTGILKKNQINHINRINHFIRQIYN